MKDRRPLIALLVIFVLLVGGTALTRLGGGGGDDTPEPIGTSVPTTEAPKATTDDWRAGLDKVVAGENAAYANPDPTVVAGFMLPTCSCYQQTVDRVNALKLKGQHVDGANIVITRSDYVDSPAPNRVRVTVRFRPDGKNTVDSSGKVTEASPTGAFAPLIYTLEKQTDGSWRIADRRAYEERG